MADIDTKKSWAGTDMDTEISNHGLHFPATLSCVYDKPLSCFLLARNFRVVRVDARMTSRCKLLSGFYTAF